MPSTLSYNLNSPKIYMDPNTLASTNSISKQLGFLSVQIPANTLDAQRRQTIPRQWTPLHLSTIVQQWTREDMRKAAFEFMISLNKAKPGKRYTGDGEGLF